MKKPSDISEEDSALFRKVVGNIKPLKQDSVLHKKPKPSTGGTTMQDSEYDQNLLERGDELSFYRPEIQKRTRRKLQRGQFNIEAELDLHGLTIELARTALSDFLLDCHMSSRRKSERCVLIIHGKGIGSDNKKPIIKNKVNNWLPQRDDVLAFCSALPADGGTGAIYLLLKTD